MAVASRRPASFSIATFSFRFDGQEAEVARGPDLRHAAEIEHARIGQPKLCRPADRERRCVLADQLCGLLEQLGLILRFRGGADRLGEQVFQRLFLGSGVAP